MKKSKKTKPTKISYHENPWGADAPVIGARVDDFLPSPKQLKAAKVRIVRDAKEVALQPEDNQRLKRQAEKVGISPEALMSAIVHDYLRGRLVPVNR